MCMYLHIQAFMWICSLKASVFSVKFLHRNKPLHRCNNLNQTKSNQIRKSPGLIDIPQRYLFLEETGKEDHHCPACSFILSVECEKGLFLDPCCARTFHFAQAVQVALFSRPFFCQAVCTLSSVQPPRSLSLNPQQSPELFKL